MTSSSSFTTIRRRQSQSAPLTIHRVGRSPLQTASFASKSQTAPSSLRAATFSELTLPAIAFLLTPQEMEQTPRTQPATLPTQPTSLITQASQYFVHQTRRTFRLRRGSMPSGQLQRRTLFTKKELATLRSVQVLLTIPTSATTAAKAGRSQPSGRARAQACRKILTTTLSTSIL